MAAQGNWTTRKQSLWTVNVSADQPSNPDGFLGSCRVIDVEAPSVQELAASLSAEDDVATARHCFEFVRDEIQHSSDFQRNPVTCSASSVLEHGTGFCYAKSHLLCALLRANRIPAGLCYQRLSIEGHGEPFCLHGLNAVWLSGVGWYRVDPRGNRDDINARFEPPHEQLAFSTDLPGEGDLSGIHVSPLEVVESALTGFSTWNEVCANLPDLSLGTPAGGQHA